MTYINVQEPAEMLYLWLPTILDTIFKNCISTYITHYELGKPKLPSVRGKNKKVFVNTPCYLFPAFSPYRLSI